MLQLVADKGIRACVETRPMKDANQVLIDMEKGLARYRYVLVNGKHLE
jgi:alcohol dehydrogenase (NADP+)